MKQQILNTAIMLTIIAFSSQTLAMAPDEDMARRHAATKLQLEMHNMLNGMMDKKYNYSSEAINEFVKFVEPPASVAKELRAINTEGNEAKHKWK